MPTSGRVAMAVVLAVVIAIVEAEKDATTTATAYPPRNTSTTPVPVSTDPSANKQNWKGVSLGSPAAKAGVVFAAAFLVSPPDPTTAAPAHTHTRCEVSRLNFAPSFFSRQARCPFALTLREHH